MDKLDKLVTIGAVMAILIAGAIILTGPVPQGQDQPVPRGSIRTIDIGYYNATEMKQAVPFREKEWANGTHSNSRIDPGGKVTIDIRDSLTVASTLTISPTSGSWKWYPANQTGNMVFYRNAIANVSYTDWDTILKEQIVLTAPVSAISWLINLSVKPQTLTVTVDGDDYLIKNPAYGEWWIRVRKPFVVDANKVRRDLKYSWNNGQKRLTLVQDFSGLTYPLTIDPTYIVDPGNVATNPYPHIFVNASNYPMVMYGFSGLGTYKFAVNRSGTWTLTNLYGPHSSVCTISSALAPSTGLPVMAHVSYPATASSYTTNITWFYGGKWRTQSISGAYPENQYSNGAIGISTATGRVLFPYFNATFDTLNITRLESVDVTLLPASYEHVVVPKLADSILWGISGEMNSSNTLNFIWGAGFGTTLNLSTATDSSSPAINTVAMSGVYLNSTSNRFRFAAKINPLTDLPGAAYIAGIAAGDVGRTINYTYYSGGKLYFETAYANTSSGMSRIYAVAMGYNTTGTPYIGFTEYTAGTVASGKILQYVKRTSAGTWSSPVTIASYTDYQPSLAFDSSDNLHMAYWDANNSDLMYYFEALPGGAIAPVAAFSCTPLITPRNGTVACTDASTNTPTSWDWYSPPAATGLPICFSGNLSNQNPNIFPMQWGYCGLCEIATNSAGTDTECKPNYIYVRQP